MPERVVLEFDQVEDAKALRDAVTHKGYVIVPLKHPVHGWRHVSSRKLYPQLEEAAPPEHTHHFVPVTTGYNSQSEPVQVLRCTCGATP